MRAGQEIELEEHLRDAKGIAWDTCHKIYILMDDAQVEKMRGYGYGDSNDPDSLITAEQMTPEKMFDVVNRWYDDSCELRFIEAVTTNLNDPNEGFVSIIPQLWA
jgi:hypothetical protein